MWFCSAPDCLAVPMDLKKPCLPLSIVRCSNFGFPSSIASIRIERLATQYDYVAASP
jgi:hypothetical protein